MKKIFSPKFIARIFKTPAKEWKLLLEAFILLAYARIRVLTISFKKIAQKMGIHMKEASLEIPNEKRQTINDIAKAISRSSRFTPFRAMCFEQAIVANIMLKRRKLSYTIYFGVIKNNDNLIAHAWTRSGDIILTGRRGHKKFKMVSCFSQSF